MYHSSKSFLYSERGGIGEEMQLPARRRACGAGWQAGHRPCIYMLPAASTNLEWFMQ